MIVRTERGYFVGWAKGHRQGPYKTLDEAVRALNAGAAESCSDGGCQA